MIGAESDSYAKPVDGTVVDPSSSPATDYTEKIVERYRFVVDLDQDGDKDLILSDGIHLFGNAGGPFHIWINEGGQYKDIGVIFAHPFAVSLEHYNGRNKLWLYQRGGGGTGMLGYVVIHEDRLLEPQLIEIHPGDSGTEMSQQLYNSIFEGPNRLTVEKSTSTDKTITWEPYTVWDIPQVTE